MSNKKAWLQYAAELGALVRDALNNPETIDTAPISAQYAAHYARKARPDLRSYSATGVSRPVRVTVPEKE